jgi:hypothetical protein
MAATEELHDVAFSFAHRRLGLGKLYFQLCPLSIRR